MTRRAPKIAVCVSGQLRTWKSCVERQIAFLSGCDCDVFLHLWTTDAITPELIHRYHPKRINRQKPFEFDDMKLDLFRLFPHDCPLDMPVMFEGMAQAYQTMAAYEIETNIQYSHVIRLRYDYYPEGRLTHLPKNDEILIPDMTRESDLRINDQFAIGGRRAMDTYFGFIDYLDAMLSGGTIPGRSRLKNLSPENLFGDYLYNAVPYVAPLPWSGSGRLIRQHSNVSLDALAYTNAASRILKTMNYNPELHTMREYAEIVLEILPAQLSDSSLASTDSVEYLRHLAAGFLNQPFVEPDDSASYLLLCHLSANTKDHNYMDTCMKQNGKNPTIAAQLHRKILSSHLIQTFNQRLANGPVEYRDDWR